MQICCQWSFYTHGTDPTTDLTILNNLPTDIRQSQLFPVLFGLKCTETRGLRCRRYFYNTQLRLHVLGPGGAGTRVMRDTNVVEGVPPRSAWSGHWSHLHCEPCSDILWEGCWVPAGQQPGANCWAGTAGGPPRDTHGTKFSPRASRVSDPQSQILTSILLPTKTKAFSWLKSPECNKENINYFPKNLSQKTSPNIYGLSSGLGLWTSVAFPQAGNPWTVLLFSVQAPAIIH